MYPGARSIQVIALTAFVYGLARRPCTFFGRLCKTDETRSEQGCRGIDHFGHFTGKINQFEHFTGLTQSPRKCSVRDPQWRFQRATLSGGL